MLTICNWNTSPIELKTLALALDKGIADFQFTFTGQQYLFLLNSVLTLYSAISSPCAVVIFYICVLSISSLLPFIV